MKKVVTFALAFALLLTVAGCGNPVKDEISKHAESVSENLVSDIKADDMSEAYEESVGQNEEEKMIYADTGRAVLEIEPADNSSADAFVALLEQGNVTVSMRDYGDFEKVGSLGSSLPTNDESITTEPGDVILYQGDQITIYYDTNTWDFTRLGKVRNLSQEELKEALGEGDVTVEFSLGGNSSVSTNIGEFDFDKKSVLLNSGYEMPIMGLGTYSLDHDTCVNSVKALLQNGGRLIDTAYMYENENSVDETLERLGVDYVDLLYIHQPAGNWLAGYRQLEKVYKEGKAKSIGISNFEGKYIEELQTKWEIVPQFIQVEAHPYFTQKELRKTLDKYDIRLMSWYPLGHGDKSLIEEPVFAEIGKKYGKSPAQVILRWHTQMGFVVIPGSKNVDHIRDNLDILDFKLTEDEMAEVAKLDKDERYYHRTEEQLIQFAGWKPEFEKA